MLTPVQKAKLASAMEKLREADVLVQEALAEEFELCFDIHMYIESCIADIDEAVYDHS